jgi:hypothetical protein
VSRSGPYSRICPLNRRTRRRSLKRASDSKLCGAATVSLLGRSHDQSLWRACMSRTETRSETSPHNPAGATLHSAEPRRANTHHHGRTTAQAGGTSGTKQASHPSRWRWLARFWQARPQHWALLFCTIGRKPGLPNRRRRLWAGSSVLMACSFTISSVARASLSC